MKQNFVCTLTGKNWWKPFMLFIVLFLAVFIPVQLASMGPSTDSGKAMATFFFVLAMEGLLIVIQAAFSVVLMKIAYAAISANGKPFSFTGDIGQYVKINILGFLLCLVTLGFYIPVYARKVTAYVVEHSAYDGEKARFLSRTSKLYKYYVLALLLPVIAIVVIFGLILANSPLEANSPIASSAGGIVLVLYLVLFIALIPFIYLAYKWMVNIGWKNLTISWDTQFWPSCRFLLVQLLLSVVTLGIYWPAAIISVYRYFAGKTVIGENGSEKSRLGFEGKTGKGFALLWGQTLLTVITCGIYLPWAYANCLRYFVNATVVQEKQDLLGRD
jgi:uncharacterized membrane protein YjgN (DUF898 family)